MDNAQKAIMLGVGLFITIIVIAAVMAITGIGQDLISSSQTKLSGLTGQLASQTKKEFDNQKMSGSLVRSYVDTYYNDDTIAVYLCTNNEAFDAKYLNTEVAKATSKSVVRISAASLGSKGVYTLYDTDGSSIAGGSAIGTTIAENVKVSSIAVTGASLTNTKHDAQMTGIKSQINAGSQFKSVTITDDDTGALVGIVFVRYQ